MDDLGENPLFFGNMHHTHLTTHQGHTPLDLVQDQRHRPEANKEGSAAAKVDGRLTGVDGWEGAVSGPPKLE